MYRFAKPASADPIEVECVHNRELTTTIQQDMLFYVLSDDFDAKFGIDKSLGEIAIYSPKFEVDLSCAWVAQASDFEYINDSLIRR